MLLNKRELKQYRVGKIRVYKVNGSFVRKNHFTGFTLGGHWLCYEFIPKYEVWIEDVLENSEEEQGFTVLHEFEEIYGMLQGLSYDDSHARYANVAEGMARHNGKLKSMLKATMLKLNNVTIDEPSHYNGHIHNHKRNHKLHTHLPSDSNKLIGLR
jgi:hypothetical protein